VTPAPSLVGLLVCSAAYVPCQEARGSGINAGQNFYIENVLEELDAPGEWFYDADKQLLYVYPNGTDLTSAVVTLPIANAIVTVNGTAASPAQNISFIGLTFTQVRWAPVCGCGQCVSAQPPRNYCVDLPPPPCTVPLHLPGGVRSAKRRRLVSIQHYAKCPTN
jgi:hypothetical protein